MSGTTWFDEARYGMFIHWGFARHNAGAALSAKAVYKPTKEFQTIAIFSLQTGGTPQSPILPRKKMKIIVAISKWCHMIPLDLRLQVMITTTEIAQMACVSRTAVSHVINGRGGKLGAEKRRNVETLLRDHRYQRNGLVRALKAKRTHSLVVMVPSVRFSFYAQVVDAMEAQARKLGYHLFLNQTHMDSSIIRSEISHLRERRVDGFIVAPVHGDTSIYRELHEGGDRLVLLDSFIEGTSIPYVDTNDYSGAVLAAQHLISSGHRSFLIHAAVEDDMSPMATLRLKGYVETLISNGIDKNDIHVRRDGLNIEHGYNSVAHALKEGIRFSAVLAATDMAAIGAIRALQNMSLSVPDDVAVVGYGNIEEGRYVSPPLSTIDQNPDRLGVECINMIHEIIKTGNSPTSMMIEPKLIISESSQRKNHSPRNP